MVRGRYRVGVSKTKTKEKIMMKKKVMPLSCLMAAAMLAGCGTAAPAVPEETTAPAVETAEAAQETAPADAAESEAAAVEKTAGVWQVEPCYNFDEIVPLYSEWDHTAGKNAADGLYAVRDGERWSLFSTKTGNIMMQDAAQQMPYLYGTNELSVWLDDEYYNYDNFAAMREKCEGLNAELQANGAEIEVLYDGVGGYANRWIYTEDGQIYYDLLGTYEFSGTPLVQVSDASALFGVRPATWDNEYRCYTVANGAPYAVARSDGSLLSSFRYKNVCMAGDELIAVEDTDGNWGYCDINGEEVIPCTYQAAMQAEGASEPIDYPFPDMSGVVVVQDADGARMALYTDGTVCIEAGRLSHITLGIYDDFSQDYDINFDYTDGKASASFDAAQAAAMEGSPYVLEVTDLTLKDDGTPDALSACTDCAVYIEFNEDGLPSFFAVAQEDVGYQITYTRTDDGRFVMDSAQCVYGYIYNHSAEPTNDFFTPTGEILYQ